MVIDQMSTSLVIGFGSEMGNAEDVALTFAENAEAAGLPTVAVELNGVDVTQLGSASHFIAVTSTSGDGEFPHNAAVFWEELQSCTQSLSGLNYAVLALGDSTYNFFCNAGRLLDTQLEKLGATRILDRIDIDGGDYLATSAAWTEQVLGFLTRATERPSAGVVAVSTGAARTRLDEQASAPLVATRRLTSPNSTKEVCHYEIDLSGTGITYQAGDSLAVQPHNDPRLVDAIMSTLSADPDMPVPGYDQPMQVVLTEHAEIRTPSRDLITLVSSRTRVTPRPLNRGGDVLELIRVASVGVDDFISTLRPLQPRYYSISSSPLMHPDHAHLTISSVRYRCGDRLHGGVASTFLADRCWTARIQLRPNHTFRLPADDVPIIMIGPGTGIAPFRGFLQERQARSATGQSWLFFGDRTRGDDFLYRDEIDEFRRSRTLTRLDLAFSRDQGGESKTYVQHRMCRHADEIFSWLQDGAHLYVCGNADRMAKDVDSALHRIVEVAGGMDAPAAHAYVNALIRGGRYLRDVY